jgi:nucleotide-binding universal stress UspA family protein
MIGTMLIPRGSIIKCDKLSEEKGPFMNIETTANPSPSTAECVGPRPAQQHAGEDLRGVIPPQIQNILVAVDFSDYSEAALRYATFLAEKFGATLTLVHAVEPYVYPEDLSAGFTIEEIDRRWMQRQKEKLETLRQTIKEGIPATVVVTMGTAWNRIVGAAKSWNADLVVIGTHGRTGLKHALMGSTAERVVRHATIPVLVVHLPGATGQGRRIR